MASNGKGKEAPDLLAKKYSYRAPRIDAEAFQATIPDLITATSKPARTTAESQPSSAAPAGPPPSHHHRTRKATGKLTTSKVIVLPGEGDSPGEKKSGGGNGSVTGDDDNKEPGSSAASVAGSEKDELAASVTAPLLPLSLRPHQASLQEDLVWDPSCVESAAVDDYLIFVRNIIEHTVGEEGRKVHCRWKKNSRGEVIPLESDQLALEFLQLHKGNVAAAELQLLSELGIRKEHAYIEALDNLCPSGASARGLESRDRSCLMGAFHSGVPGSGSARDRASKYQYRFGRSISDEGSGEGGAAASSSSSSAAGDKKKRGGADRSEVKKMWANLQSQANALKQRVNEAAKARGGADPANKVRFIDVHLIIREAATLPSLEAAPGESSSKTIDDLLDNLRERAAQARKYIAMVHDALNTSAGEPRTLEALQRLLTTIRGQPILLEEDALLDNVIREAEAWQKRAKEVVDNLERGKTSELEVKTLLQTAKALPVRFDSRTMLEARMAECEALGREIRAAFPQKSRNVVYQKLETLLKLQEKVFAVKLTFAEGDYLNKIVKRTQRWCAETQEVVSRSPDLKKLNTLLGEAGSIPVDLSSECAELNAKVEQAAKWVEKVRKALPKKNKTRRTGEVSKVDYTAARSLLTEGNDIRVDMKELEDIAGALGTAEEWLQRVREALEDATDTTSLQALESLLVEADDIPVIMEEHKILAAEIEARKWALKIQPRLESSKLTAEELSTVIDEAAQLRSRLPITPRHQKNWKIPQEVEARRILDAVQVWMNKFRKCLMNPNSAPLSDRKDSGRHAASSPSSMVLKRGVAVSTLEELISEAKEVPANLQGCVAVLQAGLDGVKGWYDSWKDLLQRCQEVTADGDAMEVDDTAQDGAKAKVALQQVAQCVSAAESVGVELPEVENLKTLIQRVNAWIEHVGNACPQRLSKRKSRAKATLSEVRQLLDEGTHFPVDVQEEADKVRTRLEATAAWQQQCQADLVELNREAEEHLAKFEAALEVRSKKTDEEEEDEEVDTLLALEEVRIKRLEELTDKAGDVVIDTPEEKIVSRHLQAHKWFQDVAGVLLYDQKLISDDHIVEAEEAISEGEKLLGLAESRKSIKNEKKALTKSNKRKKRSEDGEDEEGEEGDDDGRSSVVEEDATGGGTEAETEDGDEASKDKTKEKGDEDGDNSTMATEGEENEESVKVEADEKEEEKAVEEVKVVVEKTPCEETLEKLLQRWWEKLEGHRRIMEVSRAWRAKAGKAIGSEKMKLPMLEDLIEEASGFDFELEQVKKVTSEYQKAKSIQSRAAAVLDGSTKLQLADLKSLIGEGDKCKVQMEEVKALKKHLTVGNKWMQRFEKARDEMDAGSADQIPEMKALYEEIEDLRIDISEELPVIKHIITRCCLCRGFCEGDLMPCTQCAEEYHVKCLQIDEAKKDKFICPRCHVRRHFKNSVDGIVAIAGRWVDPVKADNSPEESRDSDPGHQKVKALMKRALQTLRYCIEGGPEEIKTIARNTKGNHRILEVARLVTNEACTEVTDPLWMDFPETITMAQYFYRLAWASKLLYQLRRRPARNVLYAQLMATETLKITDRVLESSLGELYTRATSWVERTKDLIRRGRLDEENGLDVDGLKRLLEEKKSIPVMVKEEGRALQVLDEGGARWCHCKGFYDGSSMIECSTCKNWFHSRCVGLKKEELAKLTYHCLDCCRKKGTKYTHPEYRPPEYELIGDGGEDDDEENLLGSGKAETPEIITADTKSLEKLWPPLDTVLRLEDALADVDSSSVVFANARKKKGGGMAWPVGGYRSGSSKDRYRREPGLPFRHYYEGGGWPMDVPYRPGPHDSPLRGSLHRHGSDEAAHYQRLLMMSGDYKGGGGPRPRPSKKKRPQYEDEDYAEEPYDDGGPMEWEESPMHQVKKAKRAPKSTGRSIGQLPPHDFRDGLELARDKVNELEAHFTDLGRKEKMRRTLGPPDRLDDERLGPPFRRMEMDRGPPSHEPSPHRRHLPPPLPSHPNSKVFAFTLGEGSRYPGAELGGGRHAHGSSNHYGAPYHHLPPPPPPPGGMYRGGGHRLPPPLGYGGGFDRLAREREREYRPAGGGGRPMEGGKGRRMPDVEENEYDEE